VKSGKKQVHGNDCRLDGNKHGRNNQQIDDIFSLEVYLCESITGDYSNTQQENDRKERNNERILE
jgi:hypothetical protein